MSVFSETPTADKVFLYLLQYLSLWSENTKMILGYTLELIEKLKNECDDESVKILNNLRGVLFDMLEELRKPNYIPIPALDFKTDSDVKTLTEPSIEDLTESEKEDLMRFFDNDDMAEYLLGRLSETTDNDFDIVDLEDNADYFTLVKYNELHQRLIITSGAEQRDSETDETAEQ